MMREARREGSPYPKADLTLRGLARLVDFALAFAVTQAAHEVGPILGVLYLLLADGFMHGQSVGKRLFGVRSMVLPRRVPAGYRESMLRNAPFALVALFSVVPIAWLLVLLVGLPIVAFEGWMAWSDRLGVRIGDIFADTQVVDAKVVAKIEVVAHPLHPVAPAPPSQRVREAPAAGAARGAA